MYLSQIDRHDDLPTRLMFFHHPSVLGTVIPSNMPSISAYVWAKRRALATFLALLW